MVYFTNTHTHKHTFFALNKNKKKLSRAVAPNYAKPLWKVHCAQLTMCLARLNVYYVIYALLIQHAILHANFKNHPYFIARSVHIAHRQTQWLYTSFTSKKERKKKCYNQSESHSAAIENSLFQAPATKPKLTYAVIYKSAERTPGTILFCALQFILILIPIYNTENLIVMKTLYRRDV